MAQDNDPIKKQLDEISKAVVLLMKKVSSLEQRMDKEEETKEAPSFSAGAPSAPEMEREVPPAKPQESVKPEDPFGSGSKADSDVEKKSTEETQEKENLETEIGSKWLGRIGVLALVFGVAFFLKYAFENDWIGETGRVAIGILSGMVLIYLGDLLRQKYNAYAATLTGGGIAVLYLSIYSSFAYYQLVGQIPAFLVMMIITAAGAFLAVRYEQISLAILSILGGFLTPLLISTGTNNQIELFIYITILNLGILGISYYRNWQKLNLFGFIATIFLYLNWSVQYYDKSQLFFSEAFLTLWFILYVVAVVSHNVLHKKKADISDLALIVFNALVYFGISYALLSRDYGDYLGFFAVLMAVIYFVFAYISYQLNPEDKKLALFFPGLSIFFLTIAAPIQFDGVWVTIVWAIEAMVLVRGGFYLGNYAMRHFAWILLGIVSFRLIFIDKHETTLGADYIMIFNKRFLTFMVGVISFSVVYYLYSRYKDLIKGKEVKAMAVALLLMNFLFLWNLSAEVSIYFNDQIETKITRAVYPSCLKEYDSRGRRIESVRCDQEQQEYHSLQRLNSEKIKKIRGVNSTSLTVLWALYAIILLAFGIQGKKRLLRLMGIGLLGIVIAKLFLYDLWSMGGIYRIVSSITLGVILLSASFAYSKYKEKIKEMI